MREIVAEVTIVRQRCASPINSCQSGTDRQFIQVTTARRYDDCVVASWYKNAPPAWVDRERLGKGACREYLRSPADFDCLRWRSPTSLNKGEKILAKNFIVAARGVQQRQVSSRLIGS